MKCGDDKVASQAFAAAGFGDADAPLRSRPRKMRDPAQHQLTLEPMPARIDLCLALLKPRPPKGRQWAFEVYRLTVHIEPKSVRILTRGDHDWTDRFPAIAAQAKRLPVSTAILDGEAVVFDEMGPSASFSNRSAAGAESGYRGNQSARSLISYIWMVMTSPGRSSLRGVTFSRDYAGGGQERFPKQLEAIAKTVVHNLRAALDLMVAAIIHGGGREVKKQTGFSMSKAEAAFERELGAKLENVPAPVVKFIRRLKPYDAGNQAPLLPDGATRWD